VGKLATQRTAQTCSRTFLFPSRRSRRAPSSDVVPSLRWIEFRSTKCPALSRAGLRV